MRNVKSTLNFLICASLSFFLVSCGDKPSKKDEVLHVLKVGVTAGPHSDVMNHVKEEAKKNGLDIQILEFNDFILPNTALSTKDLDLNCYQHLPFLKEQNKTRKYHLKAIAKTLLMPIGVYSKKIKNLKELKNGATIAIPNDPTNGGRALLLLEKLGLLLLKKHEHPTIHHIKENKRHFIIKEIEAPILPRVLADVDIALINTDWVLVSGINPSTALSKEDKDSPYANVIAIREEDAQREDINKFVKIYQTDDTKKFVNERYKGAVIAAW